MSMMISVVYVANTEICFAVISVQELSILTVFIRRYERLLKAIGRAKCALGLIWIYQRQEEWRLLSVNEVRLVTILDPLIVPNYSTSNVPSLLLFNSPAL